MEHVSCTGSRQVVGVLENGYTGMSPFTSLELPSAIPNMYVYIKCIHEVCTGANYAVPKLPQLWECQKMICSHLLVVSCATLATLRQGSNTRADPTLNRRK